MLSALKIKNTYRNQIIEIPVELIKPNPYQPRHTFNKESLSELADSIKEYGVLQPISVRRISFNKYELVTGERRLKASIKMKITTVQ